MTNQNRAKEVAIKIDSVSKDFNLPHEVDNNLKQKLLHPLKRNSTEKQHALKDISFNINKGDFFGIVGRNGSGKSTLLKIIAEIYTPTKGNVTVNGSLTPFIELGVGFNPELTGRENVYLNGAMLGFSKKEVRKMYAEIVEFAELEKFMDQKLKNYSSGMQVRLAFSVAIRAKSDILLLDEVLAVGDSVFQQKCFNYFKQLKKESKTVILVSHDTNTIEQFCNKVVYLKDSKVAAIGKPSKVSKLYIEDTYTKIKGEKESGNSTAKGKRWGTNKFIIDSFSVTDIRGAKKKIFNYKEDIVLNFSIKRGTSKSEESIVYGFTLKKPGESAFYAFNTIENEIITSKVRGENQSVSITFKAGFGQQNLLISPAIADSFGREIYDWKEDDQEINILNEKAKNSLIGLECIFKEEL